MKQLLSKAISARALHANVAINFNIAKTDLVDKLKDVLWKEHRTIWPKGLFSYFQ